MGIIKYPLGILISFLTMSLCANSMDNTTSVNIILQKPTQHNLIQVSNTSQKDELKEIVTDMKCQLVAAQSEIENLQESNYNLKKTLTVKEQQIQELHQINQSKIVTTLTINDSEINNLKNLVNSYEKRVQELSLANNKQLNTVLNAKNSEIDELKSLVRDYKDRFESLSLKLVSTNSELSSTQERYAQLANNKQNLHNDYINLQNKTSELQNKIQQEKSLNSSLQEQGIYAQAAEHLKKDKENAAIFYTALAKAYQEKKDYQQAVKNYNQALVINPNFAKAYCDLGIMYAEIGQKVDSVNNLNKYLKYANNPKEKEVIKNFISKIEKTNQG